MPLPQRDELSRDERNSMSPEQWKAHHARADAQKLVNPPPSLAGFLPDKPPPPKLAASPTGKVAAHARHAPLTHSLGDALRELLPGETMKVNPLVVVTSEKGKPVVASNDTPPPSKKRLELGEQYIAGNAIRTRRKPETVHLTADERREALVWAIAYGSHESSMRFNVSQGAIGPWLRMLDSVIEGEPMPYDTKRLFITGVNTPGSTRASAQAIRDEAARLRDTPETVLEAPALEPSKGTALVQLLEEHAREPKPPTEVEQLKEQLAERSATLAGYQIELTKLRAENELLQKQNKVLQEVTESLSAAVAGKRGR